MSPYVHEPNAAGVIGQIPRKLRQRLAVRRRLATLRQVTTSADARRRWQRDRFFAHAKRHTPVIAVDDRNGHRFFVNTSDPAIGRGLFLDGTFESENLNSLFAQLHAEELAPQQIIDVGANIGTSTVSLLARMPKAIGIAFEPDGLNYRLLLQNLLANNMFERVQTFNAAVSDRDDTVQLELSPQQHGDHRVRLTDTAGRFGEDTWAVTTIQSRKLDSLVQQGEIDAEKPSLLWIDAQGHEAQILSGAQLLRHVPTVVELWPYGLRRAGGLERFIALASSYEKIIELGRRPKSLNCSDLLKRVNQLDETGQQYTDLLLLPIRSSGVRGAMADGADQALTP